MSTRFATFEVIRKQHAATDFVLIKHYEETGMDFLKSAVASAIAKSSSFPFTIGDRVDSDDSIWIMNNGTRKVG